MINLAKFTRGSTVNFDSVMTQFIVSLARRQNVIIVPFDVVTGAIIGDGDRKRALILLLGLPHDMGQFFYF